jgi:hypothetical protein
VLNGVWRRGKPSECFSLLSVRALSSLFELRALEPNSVELELSSFEELLHNVYSTCFWPKHFNYTLQPTLRLLFLYQIVILKK